MDKRLIIGISLILILGLCVGFSLSRWVFEPKTKYGTIEEVVDKLERDSITQRKTRDSLKGVNVVLKRESEYLKILNFIEDEKFEKLRSKPLTNFQRDSLERAIFED